MPLVDGKFLPLEVSEKIANVLFDNSRKWRYRWLYGGRGAGKDWGVASAVVERSVRVPTRVLFTREIQNSIKDSIHRLLCDTIARLGYSKYFDCLENEIRGINGSLCVFRGIRHNTNEIKSLEGIDLCVLCEAQDLTKESWTILDPTIRKENSEIWGMFNTGFDDDFVFDRFVTNKPENAIVQLVNYYDNPWCPKELIEQAERMRREEPELYKNIWLGEPLGQGGRVFPMYSREIHEIDFDLNMLPQCDLYMSIDPHRKYYPAITWYAITPTAATVVYNEWPKFEDLGMWYDEARNVKSFDMSIDELANVILANDLTLQYGGGPVTRTGDPRFLAENPDVITRLMEKGVLGWTDAPFERIETQRENLKSLINYNPAIPLCGTNMPDWYVSKRCTNKSRAYRRHCWSDEKDKESETNKDFIDNDRYFLSIVDGRPKYRGPELIKGTGQLPKSLSELQLSQMPVQGYFNVVRSKR